MTKILIYVSLLMIFFQGSLFSQVKPTVITTTDKEAVYKNPEADVETRVNDLFSRMTIEEKVNLLRPNYFSTKPNERLGIPQLKFENGSNGLRSGRSTAFSTGVNFAATWDPELIYKVGVAMGKELKSNGRNMLLGPCIEIHRIPQNGRNAESFSEDPFLSGMIVCPLIEGIQSQKRAATACFFGPKTQEYHTRTYDAQIDERTLNEIYFPAFKRAVEESHVMGIMTPYNKANGEHISNSQFFLWNTLKTKWKFQGVVMTDWAGVQNFDEGIYAGLDLDTPEGLQYTAEKLTEVYKKAQREPNMAEINKLAMKLDMDISEAKVDTAKKGITIQNPGNFAANPLSRIMAERLDESVKRILRVMFTTGLFEEEYVPPGFDTIAHNSLALKVAHESIVLLRNRDNILPLDRNKIKSIAVIGPNADASRNSILYAAEVLPNVVVTPLNGILKKAGKGIEINYSKGVEIEELGLFVTDEYLKTTEENKGFLVEFFDNHDFQGKPVFSTKEHSVAYKWWVNPARPELGETGEYSVRATGLWSPPRSGYYCIYAPRGGSAISGNQIPDNSKNGREPLKTIRVNDRLYQYFEKGKSYPVKGEIKSQKNTAFEIRYLYYELNAMKNAVEAARKSDVAVLFLGFSEQLEKEGQDRTPGLPENQIELLNAVVSANPDVIVVLNTGSGVSINPWGDKVKAILEACYPGQEGGTAVADILFGDVNPSGKLPFTCIKDWNDSPVYGYYPQGPDEMLHFVEGIYVGYRWFDRQDTPDAAYSFGHGLSYTTFGYSNLKITPDATRAGEFSATVTITNTGRVAGAEVVQLYIGDDLASIDRPVKELKGFKRVFLQPGANTEVRFPIHIEDLKFYDTNIHNWKAEPGIFTLYIGSSSVDIRQVGKFELAFF